ncbi:MAG: hypothetical protein HQK89_13305 [Nitrospirae bacterium]|nr:hypothetical protein [Nitrospirota bacterium]
MKKLFILFAIMFCIANTSNVEPAFTQADRDRIIRLEDGLKATNQKIEDGLKATRRSMTDRRPPTRESMMLTEESTI